MKFDRSIELYNESFNYLAGGVSAGQRYINALGHALYLDHANGSKLYDVDGNEFIDYHTGAGAALFGHNHPRLKAAAERSIEKGFFMNYETESHIELAGLIQKLFPSAERIRFSNTGTEATQGAMRIARAYTGRDIVIRFDGHFHGMNEMIWYNHVKLAEMDEHGQVELSPDSKGFPSNPNDAVKVVEYNNIDALEYCIKQNKDNVAAVILEPISYNCGCFKPHKEYLEQVRALCDREGVVLIFDEVICALRMRPGSAQLYYGVTPDVTCIAKGMAGGFPISAILGKKDVMDVLAPVGKVVMSGTYTGSYMPVLASIECFKMALEPGFYDHIEAIGNKLYDGISDLFTKHNLKGFCTGVGARFAIYWGIEDENSVYDWRVAAAQFDRPLYKRFVKLAIENGLYFHDTAGPISPAHRGITTQHSMEDIDLTLTRMDDIFAKLAK